MERGRGRGEKEKAIVPSIPSFLRALRTREVVPGIPGRKHPKDRSQEEGGRGKGREKNSALSRSNNYILLSEQRKEEEEREGGKEKKGFTFLSKPRT